MVSDLMQVSAEFYLRGIWPWNRPSTERERQLERQTQIRLRGRGELGWKDSGEQSEINLDTPDGLKFVCVAALLLYLGLCIYMCLCICVTLDKEEHLVCAQCINSALILMDKNTQKNRHRFC